MGCLPSFHTEPPELVALHTSLLLCQTLKELGYNLPALVGTCSKCLMQKGLQPTALTIPWHGGLCSNHSLGATTYPAEKHSLQLAVPAEQQHTWFGSTSPLLFIPSLTAASSALLDLCRVGMCPVSSSAAFTQNGGTTFLNTVWKTKQKHCLLLALT